MYLMTDARDHTLGDPGCVRRVPGVFMQSYGQAAGTQRPVVNCFPACAGTLAVATFTAVGARKKC